MITAAGAIFLAKSSKRAMLNFRSPQVSKGHTFGFWGGKIEKGETIMKGLSREITEECGYIPQYDRIIPLDIYTSRDEKFRYYSFVITVPKEFIPRLNNESSGYLWCNIGSFPRQLHTGARVILEDESYIDNLKKIAEM